MACILHSVDVFESVSDQAFEAAHSVDVVQSVLSVEFHSLAALKIFYNLDERGKKDPPYSQEEHFFHEYSCSPWGSQIGRSHLIKSARGYLERLEDLWWSLRKPPSFKSRSENSVD